MENLVEMMEQSDSLVLDFNDWDDWEEFDTAPERLQYDALSEIFVGEA